MPSPLAGGGGAQRRVRGLLVALFGSLDSEQWLMIAGLILAAGESSRMGRDKALLTYRGRTFIETILATLREAGVTRLAVVLGHHAVEIQRAVDFTGVDVIVNHHYRQGQTSSLQAGLKALDSGAGMSVEAALLCLVG